MYLSSNIIFPRPIHVAYYPFDRDLAYRRTEKQFDYGRTANSSNDWQQLKNVTRSCRFVGIHSGGVLKEMCNF